MKAKDFDKKFDQGKKDIIDDLDLSTARRANQGDDVVLHRLRDLHVGDFFTGGEDRVLRNRGFGCPAAAGGFAAARTIFPVFWLRLASCFFGEIVVS